MSGKFDVGDEVASVEQAQTKLDAVTITSCPFGHHVELSDIHYTVIEVEPGHALSDEEWLRAMREEKGLDLWTTDELYATEIRIESFAFGMPMATVRGRDFVLDMTTSPQGHRYYFAPKNAYEQAIAEPTPTVGT